MRANEAERPPASTNLVPAPTPDPEVYQATPEGLAAAWLVGFANPLTRSGYAGDLRDFANWCGEVGLELLKVQRPHSPGGAFT
jgi:hypothetical protein